MEKILKSINAMQGVLGSFICDNKGKILAVVMPSSINESISTNVGRIISQSLGGLATIHRRKIDDSELVFKLSRFITKRLGENYLCILCVRNINISLFNLTVNVAVKKLSEMLMKGKRLEVQESGKREELDSRSQLLISEAHSIISTARKQEVILKATGITAIRLHRLGAMEEILKDINNVVGVTGCYVCDNEGQVIASALPDLFGDIILASVGRIMAQTLGGLSMARHRKTDEIDLIFDQGSFMVKNLGTICLYILYTRNINIPLLNLTVNSAGRKLLSLHKAG